MGRWEELKRRKAQMIVLALLFLFYGVLTAHTIKFSASDDLGRHIKNGEMVFAGDWRVFDSNLYSYTEPDGFFANHHWLFGVVSYVLHQTVGFTSMVVLKVALLLGAFALLFAAARRRAGFWTVAFFSLPTILLLMERTSWRPETFSYLFIALFLYVLTDAQDHPNLRRLFWLIPIQILWVNTHIFFVFGLAIAAGFFLERLVVTFGHWKSDALLKKFGALTLLLALSTLLNPQGIYGATLQFPLNIKGESPIAIAEDVPVLDYLSSTKIFESVSVAVFVPSVLLLAICLVLGWRRKPIFYAASGLGAAALTFLHLRAIALYALFFLPAISAGADALFVRTDAFLSARLPHGDAFLRKALIAVFAGVLIAFALFTERLGIQRYRSPGFGLAEWSNSAGEFFTSHGIQGPIFNDADVGSSLIYHIYPRQRVFVDNRFGDAYSPAFLATYLAMVEHEEVWQEKSREYGFNAIYFYQYDMIQGGRPFLTRRMADPDWAFVYADPYVVIFVRNVPENQDLIRRFQITPENARDRLAPLLTSDRRGDRVAAADLLYLLGRLDLAMETYIYVVSRWPDTDSVWMVMGQIQLQYNDPKSSLLGLALLEKALSLGRRSAEVYSFMGLAYLRLDQLEKGKEMLERALRINPERADTRSFLDQLNARIDAEGIKLEEWD